MDIIHDFFNQFKTTFTRPSFQHFARIVMGFAQITGPKAATEVNDSANWSRTGGCRVDGYASSA